MLCTFEVWQKEPLNIWVVGRIKRPAIYVVHIFVMQSLLSLAVSLASVTNNVDDDVLRLTQLSSVRKNIILGFGIIHCCCCNIFECQCLSNNIYSSHKELHGKRVHKEKKTGERIPVEYSLLHVWASISKTTTLHTVCVCASQPRKKAAFNKKMKQ